jgi:putative ABC transport system permease protein
MIRSFFNLLEVHTGFDQRQVLTMDLSLSPRKYAEPSQAGAFFTQALDKVKNISGVTAVGLTSNLPLGGSDRSGGFYIEGQPVPVGGNVPRANLRYASPDYFRAMGIPIESGRSFTDQDNEKAVPVAVISETMAKKYWPNESALGKRIRVATLPGAPEAPGLTIVGVAGDVRHTALSARPLAELYQMYAQSPLNAMTFVVRTTADPLSMVSTVKNEVAQLDRDQPFYNIKSMDQVVSDSAALSRFAMVLLGVFAGVALVLSTVGIYGAMSYSVNQRTREIGIRMALGASPPKILQLVVKQGMKLVLIGEVIGLFAAFALTRVLTGFLFGVGSADPLTFVGVMVLLFAVALAACYFPARRATRVDPLFALRYE